MDETDSRGLKSLDSGRGENTLWSMADYIATRKSTQISAFTSRITRTHSPIVNRSQERVGAYSKGVTYGAMSKQTQAEPCVLYIPVLNTRQANQGVSLKAQIAREKLHAQYQNFLLPNTHIFIDRGVRIHNV